MSEWRRARAEAEWAEQTEDEAEDPAAAEPAYRDGSVKHECWRDD